MNLGAWIRLGRALFLGQKPNYVIAFVTGRCNLNCSYCCHAAQSARENACSRELSAEAWAGMFTGLNALIHLTITGGEPFLRDDLAELILGVVRRCGVPRISINTNGYQTQKIASTVSTILSEIGSVEVALAVSLDGTEAVHDSLRGVSGSFRAARATVESAAALREMYPNFTVRACSVLCRENADSLEAFLDETASWPIDYHDIGLVRDVPPSEQRALSDLYAQLTARQLRQASSRYLRGIDWRLQRQLRKEVLAQVHSGKGGGPCLAGGRLLEVFPDGAIRGCEVGRMWKESLIAEGAKEPTRLVDAVSLPSARKFRDRASSCGCTFECARACNVVFRPSCWWRLLF